MDSPQRHLRGIYSPGWNSFVICDSQSCKTINAELSPGVMEGIIGLDYSGASAIHPSDSASYPRHAHPQDADLRAKPRPATADPLEILRCE